MFGPLLARARGCRGSVCLAGRPMLLQDCGSAKKERNSWQNDVSICIISTARQKIRFRGTKGWACQNASSCTDSWSGSADTP